MWRLYAPGNEGVAVVTSFRKLEEAVSQHVAQQSDWLGGVGRVRYFDHFNEELLQDGEKNLLWPFMLKYMSYAHEREVRALVNCSWGQNIAAGGLDLPISPQTVRQTGKKPKCVRDRRMPVRQRIALISLGSARTTRLCRPRNPSSPNASMRNCARPSKCRR
jgi:hypothetical protein